MLELELELGAAKSLTGWRVHDASGWRETQMRGTRADRRVLKTARRPGFCQLLAPPAASAAAAVLGGAQRDEPGHVTVDLLGPYCIRHSADATLVLEYLRISVRAERERERGFSSRSLHSLASQALRVAPHLVAGLPASLLCHG